MKLQNMTQNIHFGGASGGATSPVTPSATFPGFPGSQQHQNELVMLDREYRHTLDDLKWAEGRIRELESQLSTHLIGSMGPMDVPDDPVCGLYSLKANNDKRRKGSPDELELQKMLKESEQLLTESTSNLLEPIEERRRAEFREKAERINENIESVSGRMVL